MTTWIDRYEASRKLGLKPQTIAGWVKLHGISVVGTGRESRYNLAELERLRSELEARRTAVQFTSETRTPGGPNKHHHRPRIAQMLSAGVPGPKIADQLGVSKSLVYNIRRELGEDSTVHG